MKKVFFLVCLHLGVWGILGFLATLFTGFIVCCANLPIDLFYGILLLFAITGITATTVCVARNLKKSNH